MAEQKIAPLRLEVLAERIREVRDDLRAGLGDSPIAENGFQTEVLKNLRTPEQGAADERRRTLVKALDDALHQINAHLDSE
jgi:hypothetical protein